MKLLTLVIVLIATIAAAAQTPSPGPLDAAAEKQRADRLQARLALFLGDDELATGQVKLRDLASGEERNVARETLLDELNSLV